MLPIKAWRIYYADGSTFDSTQGTMAQAPPFGVQCRVYYHAPPYKTLEARDDGIYVYRGEGEKEGLLLGLWMDDEGYHRVVDLATRSVSPEV
jgi:hypothetical protein